MRGVRGLEEVYCRFVLGGRGGGGAVLKSTKRK